MAGRDQRKASYDSELDACQIGLLPLGTEIITEVPDLTLRGLRNYH